jgi:hypothetical protein
MMLTVLVRGVGLTTAVAFLAACASVDLEQRSTQGPTAEQFWKSRLAVANGREPTFDERRHWDNDIDARITRYLNDHPEAANSLQVSTFRFHRQVAVGMSKEQVLILLGRPDRMTTDAADIERLARKYWPAIKETVDEAWVYPGGWRLYFKGPALVDITQHIPRQR